MFEHTPVGRGFDESYGFLAGGEDHYSQTDGSCKFSASPPENNPKGKCWMSKGINDASGHMGNITIVDSPQSCCNNCFATPSCQYFLCVNQSTSTQPHACRCLLKKTSKGRSPWSVPSVYGGIGRPLPPLRRRRRHGGGTTPKSHARGSQEGVRLPVGQTPSNYYY